MSVVEKVCSILAVSLLSVALVAPSSYGSCGSSCNCHGKAAGEPCTPTYFPCPGTECSCRYNSPGDIFTWCKNGRPVDDEPEVVVEE
jgi:hypothetical protein